MKFNIKYNNKLNEISEFASKNSFETVDKIKINYKILTEDAKKIACYCYKKELTKPTTIYNLIFCVEFYLKYYLLIKSNLNIMRIEQLGHNIDDLINKAKSTSTIDSFDFNDLNNLLNQFKTHKNKCLSLSEYENFRYNKQKKSKDLIFRNYHITQNEKEYIKEVLEWLNLHI